MQRLFAISDNIMINKKAEEAYPSNLSNEAWRYLKPHLPVSAVGRPRELSMRQVLNAILYILKTGCQWRQLPREFLAWCSVYYYFHRWSNVDDTNNRRQAAWPGECKRLRKAWVDGGYLVDWVAERFKFCLEVVLRPRETRKFVLLPASSLGS